MQIAKVLELRLIESVGFDLGDAIFLKVEVLKLAEVGQCPVRYRREEVLRQLQLIQFTLNIGP